jgi:hypothetical protein
MWRAAQAAMMLAIPLAAFGELPAVPGDPQQIEVHTDCPAPPETGAIVNIEKADPAIDLDQHDEMLRLLIQSVRIPSVTVRLGPDVVLDFSQATHSKFADLITPGQPANPSLILPNV